MRLISRRVRRLPAELRLGGRILLKEISAFGVVGLINFVLNLGIFNLLTEVLGWAVVRSSIVATVVTVTTSYFMNRHWSFSHRARSGLRREYTIFVAINAAALAIESVIVAGVEYGLGHDDTVSRNLAKAAGIAVGTALRFWSYKRWVFLPRSTPAGYSDKTDAITITASVDTAGRVARTDQPVGRTVNGGEEADHTERGGKRFADRPADQPADRHTPAPPRART